MLSIEEALSRGLKNNDAGVMVPVSELAAVCEKAAVVDRLEELMRERPRRFDHIQPVVSCIWFDGPGWTLIEEGDEPYSRSKRHVIAPTLGEALALWDDARTGGFNYPGGFQPVTGELSDWETHQNTETDAYHAKVQAKADVLDRLERVARDDGRCLVFKSKKWWVSEDVDVWYGGEIPSGSTIAEALADFEAKNGGAG